MIRDPLADVPDYADVVDAMARVREVAVRTPVLRSDHVDRLVGRPVWFKAENLQVTGSFKIRGAWNRCSMIPIEARPRGVVAYSSGNHAQGVAASARRMGMPATIVMPSDAPEAKRLATADLGATIRLYDRENESREEIGEAICHEAGATLVRPFDDAFVVAGQGTATLEAIEDLAERAVVLDAMLCPASGGGLLAGAALVLAERMPEARLCVVEPEGHDDHGRSLQSGQRRTNEPGFRSIADALLAPQPGELTFRVNQTAVQQAFAVSDVGILTAMKTAFERLRLVLEPGGATAFAGLLQHAQDIPGEGAILVMLSGGNVDPDVFVRALGVSE